MVPGVREGITVGIGGGTTDGGVIEGEAGHRLIEVSCKLVVNSPTLSSSLYYVRHGWN